MQSSLAWAQHKVHFLLSNASHWHLFETDLEFSITPLLCGQISATEAKLRHTFSFWALQTTAATMRAKSAVVVVVQTVCRPMRLVATNVHLFEHF